MDVKIRISVPQMWTPDARRRMTLAVEKAGFPLAVLASEPQCALAYFIDRIARRKKYIGANLQAGDTILVFDGKSYRKADGFSGVIEKMQQRQRIAEL